MRSEEVIRGFSAKTFLRRFWHLRKSSCLKLWKTEVRLGETYTEVLATTDFCSCVYSKIALLDTTPTVKSVKQAVYSYETSLYPEEPQMTTVIHPFMTWKLDYCNIIYLGMMLLALKKAFKMQLPISQRMQARAYHSKGFMVYTISPHTQSQVQGFGSNS